MNAPVSYGFKTKLSFLFKKFLENKILRLRIKKEYLIDEI